MVEQFKFVFSVRIDLVLRLEHWIKHNFKHIIDHIRHEGAHELAWCSKKRVIVALNKPDPEVFIQKEIETEEFKDIVAVIWVHFALRTEEGINNNVFNSWQKMFFHIQMVLRVVLVKILLQILIT